MCDSVPVSDQSASVVPRLLVVMRHATPEPTGVTDSARRLTAVGVDEARAAAGWLTGLGVQPDRALVSAAVRTTQTWEATGFTATADLSEALYGAGVDSAVDLIRRTEPDVAVLMVIGHNPTMSSLAQLLDDGEGDPDAERALAGAFPASAAAVFEVTVPWAELDQGDGRLIGFRGGHGYR